MKEIKILYVCNQDLATTKQRLFALNDLGIKTDVIYTFLLNEKITLFQKFKRAILFRLGFFPERNRENYNIINHLKITTYNILFIEKGISIKPSTLKLAKKIQPKLMIISYTLDDIMNHGNSSIYYRNSISFYDFHFTNKKFNVKEIEDAGGKNVYYFINGFSEHVHRPVKTDLKDQFIYGGDITFIGTYEAERANYLRYLADNGQKIKIWGWSQKAKKTNMIHPNIILHEHCIYDEEYAKVICSSRINLCFLRKENRDTETTRSIEIPATGGFMIAERTFDHKLLFEEDTEAVFFNTKEELLEKIKYYLIHEKERKQIAIRGRQRCILSKYSYLFQLKNIITIVLNNETPGNN